MKPDEEDEIMRDGVGGVGGGCDGRRGTKNVHIAGIYSSTCIKHREVEKMKRKEDLMGERESQQRGRR